MIPANPGNLLPLYLTPSQQGKQRWQRHRLPGQDRIPFGLIAPINKLLPFQLFVAGDATTDTIVWELRSPTNDATNVVLDADILEISELGDNSGYWITWKADQSILGTNAPFYQDVPTCGFWYIRLTVEGVIYDSEVLCLKYICGEDDARLELVEGSCTTGGGNVSFEVQGSVFSEPGYDYSLQTFVLGWSEVSDSELFELTFTEGAESADIRIQVVTLCGATLTRTYEATWTSGDACATLALAFVSEADANGITVGNSPSHKLTFTNTNDKDNVLYQTGYVQKLYMETPSPIFDVPDIDREVQNEVNGNGEIVRRFTRTVTRQRFEVPDLPDYVLGFLSKCGDLDSVKLVENEWGQELTLEDVLFESRRQGPFLNVGIFRFESESEAFSGCQEDFELVA